MDDPSQFKYYIYSRRDLKIKPSDRKSNRYATRDILCALCCPDSLPVRRRMVLYFHEICPNRLSGAPYRGRSSLVLWPLLWTIRYLYVCRKSAPCLLQIAPPSCRQVSSLDVKLTITSVSPLFGLMSMPALHVPINVLSRCPCIYHPCTGVESYWRC